MTAYFGSSKIKDIGEYGVYLGSQNTNCLTYTPKNINLAITATAQNTLVLKAGSKVYVPNGFDDVKYYKYTYSSWTQPVLTANGTLGGDSFAVTESGSYNDSNPAYRVFDSDTSSHCIFDKSSGYLMFYNPNPLKVTELTITNAVSDIWGTRALTAGTVYGSNNGTAFNKIKDFTNSTTEGSAGWSIDMSANTQGYKYYKIIVTDTSYSNSGAASQCMVSNLAITATQQTGSVESTSADYDYTVGIAQPKFDEVVIESDIVADNYTGYTFTAFACYVPELNKVLLDGIYTGSGNGFDYNVQENYLRLAGSYTDTTWTGKLTSLPLGLIEMTSAVGVTSIIQVFDWCGYIGSTAFVLPGVKGLIPNGFNADGTYKSIEFETDRVLLNTYDYQGSNQIACVNTGSAGIRYARYIESKTQPTWNTWSLWYNPQTNLLHYSTGQETDGWLPVYCVKYVQSISTDSSFKITSLTPYTAQPEMTYIPINAIYNGSEKVYQYHPYNIGEVLLYGANTGTMTYTLPKGVYQCCVVGGGRTQPYWTRPSGAAAEIQFRLTQSATVEIYSGGVGTTAYLKINGVTVVSCTGSTSDSVAGEYTIDTSSSYYVSTVMASNGKVSSGLSGASVSPYEEWGAGNTAGGARLAYVGA